MVTSRRSAGAGHVRTQLLVLAAIFSLTVTMLSLSTRAMGSPSGVPVLPDGRGYEKVSPNNNADGNVYAAWPLGLANEGGWTYLPFDVASSGNAVAYIGGPSEEGGIGRTGSDAGNQYVARRNSTGRWEAENVTPPSDEFFTVPTYQAFSPDLTHGLLDTDSAIPLAAGAPANPNHLYVPYARDFSTGAYTSLMPTMPPNRESKYEFGAYEISNAGEDYPLEPIFAGATADFSHVLYMANDALSPEAVDSGEEDNNLYDFTDGSLHLVNVLLDGTPEPNAVFGGPVIPPESREVNGPDFDHAISEDGNRIFWTGRGSNRNIYMRENGTRTVQIDAGAGGGGQYWTATPDGSKVLFVKSGDLYEYDVETEQTTDLVPGGEVQGLTGTSEDLSYVYFAAGAALAPEAEPQTCDPNSLESTDCNLYVLHQGEPVRFIAQLSGKDSFTKPTSFYFHDGDWQGGMGQREAQVTPSGGTVLFSSVKPLTGYENINSEGKRTEELFVYEYAGKALRCISCDRGAEHPARTESSWLPVSYQDTYSDNWMSVDGSRVFFDSQNALVPQDTNGKTDVYEWERAGSGTCPSAEAEGCIYLISNGTAGEGNYLIGASSVGNDVFFTTRAKLVAEDGNENIDIYDAHVGAVEPPVPPQCTGTGCQGLPSAPPVFSTPSSVTYNGVGNFAPEPKVATKTKNATKKTKKKVKVEKRRKAHKSRRKAGKAKKSARGRGHGSSAHGLTVSYGRSK